MEKLDYAGQRVMTRQQVAGALVCTPEQVRNVYRNFKAQFVLGEHYFALEGEALRKFKSVEKNRRALGKYASQVMLWTQKGVELLCKLFGTDKAAQVYADLARDYFNLVTVEEPDATEPIVPQIFVHPKFGKLRGLIIDGVLYFVGIDVARALGYTDPKNALADHVPDKFKRIFNAKNLQQMASQSKGGEMATFEMRQWEFDSPRGLTFVTEAGMYRLIMRSKMPKAEEFTDWVCGEVLPTLRKQGYYSLKEEPAPPKKRKPQSEFARVYGMQMHNNLVKIGCSDDVDGRMPEVERDSGWQVKDEHHTVRMDRRRALREERRLHRKYLGVNVNGEYFNAPFDDVKQDLDAISLTLEEQVVEGISDYARGKLLVELCNSKLDSPFKEQLAKQTANFLFGEKLF